MFFSEEALTTRRAKWWEILLARWLGEECNGTDELATVTAYRWRGRLYVVNVEIRREV